MLFSSALLCWSNEVEDRVEKCERKIAYHSFHCPPPSFLSCKALFNTPRTITSFDRYHIQVEYLLLFNIVQVVEHACSVPSLMLGETLPNVSRDMDTLSYRVPLGVTAGICPFNFPAMIPLWMSPMAVATGNTMLLKPSEQDPGATMMLVKLAQVLIISNFL